MKNKKSIFSLAILMSVFLFNCMPVHAVTLNTTNHISAPNEFTITSDMVNKTGEFNVEIGENYGFDGIITITRNTGRVATDDFKLTGRFYTVDDGATVSDYWMSASFYVSSGKVYIDKYDARHTKRTGLFSAYKANVNNTTASGEGTTTAKVRADFELLYNNKPSPGTSEAYLQTIYNNDKSWSISGNYDGAQTP